jgi:putative lumazine-binding protein
MATQAPMVADTAVDDYDAITMVVQQYIDGSASGETSKLEQVFDSDARMYGALGHERIDIPVQELFKMMAQMPMGPAYRARITAVHQAGDAAVAVVAEDGCWGTVSFVDFFSLAKINGSWKIVNKTFAHTGGTPPGA